MLVVDGRWSVVDEPVIGTRFWRGYPSHVHMHGEAVVHTVMLWQKCTHEQLILILFSSFSFVGDGTTAALGEVVVEGLRNAG